MYISVMYENLISFLRTVFFVFSKFGHNISIVFFAIFNIDLPNQIWPNKVF